MLLDGFEPPIFALQVQRLTNLAIRAETPPSTHSPAKKLGFAYHTENSLTLEKSAVTPTMPV